MTKDEIWEKLKRDETKIYGQSLFDVFVQTTDDMIPKHFMELDKELRNKITSDSVYRVLIKSKNKTEMAEILGQENIRKLSSRNIKRLTDSSENKISIVELLLKYDYDLSNEAILYFFRKVPDKLVLSKLIGRERVNKLTEQDILTLLYHAPNKDEHGNPSEERKEIAKAMVQYKDLSPTDVYNLLYHSLEKEKQDIATILTQENIDKLLSGQILNLLRTAIDRINMATILGKENIDKLSEEQKEEMTSTINPKHLSLILGITEDEINQMKRNRFLRAGGRPVKKINYMNQSEED